MLKKGSQSPFQSVIGRAPPVEGHMSHLRKITYAEYSFECTLGSSIVSSHEVFQWTT